ncbi:Zinc/iron permease [Naviculisporaceae sp. PSN 640]
MAAITEGFDPRNVNLTDVSDDLYRDIICFLSASTDGSDSRLTLRISALFVILCSSTVTTLFPVVATRVHIFHIPLYVYLFARYFGAGVIIATAFIHLLDPAYEAIGPASCVGLSPGWSGYPWPAGIAMTSAMLIFLLDFGAEWFVEKKFGLEHQHLSVEATVTDGHRGRKFSIQSHHSHQFLHSADQDERLCDETPGAEKPNPIHRIEPIDTPKDVEVLQSDAVIRETERAFGQRISAFMILEFGVIVHSIIIGLNLGVAGDEFSTLYPVIVFHQAFEGLGIGARLSAIPFPERFTWMPWAFCAAYGLATPLALTAGLFLSNTYDPASFTASVVSGILDSISAGILLYTGFVELLARDFLFNPDRTRDRVRLSFMLGSLFLGIILMALLGKWV